MAGSASWGQEPGLDKALAWVRRIEGSLHAVVWSRARRVDPFLARWTDADAVACWSENEFHETVLRSGSSTWCMKPQLGKCLFEAEHEPARTWGSCERCNRAPRGGTSRFPVSETFCTDRDLPGPGARASLARPTSFSTHTPSGPTYTPSGTRAAHRAGTA